MDYSDMSMRICYHGTNKENADAIMQVGFNARTWFSRNLQDAIAFGGDYVFSVAFEEPPDNWQFLTNEHIETNRIVKLVCYQTREIYENDELRKKIFASNTRG